MPKGRGQGSCGGTPRRDGSGGGIGNRGIKRGGQGNCDGIPRRDGSGGGIGNRNTINQPKK